MGYITDLPQLTETTTNACLTILSFVAYSSVASQVDDFFILFLFLHLFSFLFSSWERQFMVLASRLGVGSCLLVSFISIAHFAPHTQRDSAIHCIQELAGNSFSDLAPSRTSPSYRAASGVFFSSFGIV